MIRKKTYRMAALLCAGLLSLVMWGGCGKSEQSQSQSESSSSSSVAVKNHAGEDVVIASAPERMIILPVWAAEIALDLVDTNRIVALSSFIDSPETSVGAEKAAEVKGRVSSSEAEKIIEQQPDFIILDTFNDYDGSLGKILSEAGIAVLTLASPVNFEEIAAHIRTISQAVFAPEEGNRLVEDMQNRLEAVEQKVENLSEKTKVLYYKHDYSTTGMLSAYGPGSPFDAIAKAAGTVNVCTAANYSAISKETVVNEWKPELLVVSSNIYDENFKATDDGGATIVAEIKTDPALASLPAVKNERIAVLTEKYSDCTSHYMAYAVEELAKACYPALFA